MRPAWVSVAIWLTTFSLTLLVVAGLFALFPVPSEAGC